MHHKTAGFTLIELLIAVAVVAILAMVAIPAYTSFTQKAARSDAMAVLMDLRLEQEKYRVKNPSYTSSVSDLTTSTAAGLDVQVDGSDVVSPNKKYTISITAAGTASFTATAAPRGSQSGDGCGTFAINQNGPLTTGGYANDGCWKR